MGCGSWSSKDFATYSNSLGRSVDMIGALDSSYRAQDIFTSRRIQSELTPYNIVRECCDNEEHPNTIPVILALDVTGSMGNGAAEVAKKLNIVMTELYEKIPDVEFMIMAIGDLAYDSAPIQVSQFESDIRIAEQLDKVYFEGGGGGNGYESYTAAWYFGVRHTKLDCWRRNKKGIIITMGDEPLNPYLPKNGLSRVTGDSVEADVETNKLYNIASKKFDIYHLAVDDNSTSYSYYSDRIHSSFGKYLDSDHLRVVTLDNIAPQIVNIVSNANTSFKRTVNAQTTESNEISW